jgi:23S rRNA pseudouridine2605 synthase
MGGRVVNQLATQVGPKDHVKVDGRLIRLPESATLVLNKPAGYLCSTVPENGKKTVFDLVPENMPRLFYVGRLDLESEGLLIMTNNGDLAQQLTHPKYKLPKVYMVRLDREFNFELAPKLVKGFVIEPGFARMESIHHAGHGELKVVLTQGLKRQIRLMFYKLGYNVESLRRVQIGNLKLGEIKPGKFKFLDEKEIERDLVRPAVEFHSSRPSPKRRPAGDAGSGDQGIPDRPRRPAPRKAGD